MQMTPQWPRMRQSTVVFRKLLKKHPGSPVVEVEDCPGRSCKATHSVAPGTTASEKERAGCPGAGVEAKLSVSPKTRIGRSPMKVRPRAAQSRLAVALLMRELQVGPSASKTWCAAASRASDLAATGSHSDRIDFRIAVVPTTLLGASTQIGADFADRLSMNKAAQAMRRKASDRPIFNSSCMRKRQARESSAAPWELSHQQHHTSSIRTFREQQALGNAGQSALISLRRCI